MRAIQDEVLLRLAVMLCVSTMSSTGLIAQAPEVLSFPPLVYPPVARAARVAGPVVLEVTPDRQGAISRVEVVAGPQPLAIAAADHARRLQVAPAAGSFTVVYSFLFSSGTCLDGNRSFAWLSAAGPPMFVVTTCEEALTPQPPAQPAPKINGKQPLQTVDREAALVYPRAAREKGIVGTVVVRAAVNAAGELVSAEVVSGPGIFTGEVLRHAKQFSLGTGSMERFLVYQFRIVRGRCSDASESFAEAFPGHLVTVSACGNALYGR